MKYLFLSLACLATFAVNAQQLFHQDKPIPCLDKTFSVYVHAVLDENGNTYVTQTALDQFFANLSTAFDPICVRFELCTLDSIDNYNYVAFDREGPVFGEMKSRNHVNNRINFYFVNEIREDVAGFAALGGIANTSNAFVTMAGLSVGTAIHEVGHLFGLPHTFEGGNELVDGSNSNTAGDGIVDTPADPFVEGDDTSDYVNTDCEFISLLQDANGDFYQPLVANPMSYYGCGCGTFTYDQFLKMATTYSNANPKVW